MSSLLAWTTGIAFLGGVIGPDAVGVFCVGIAAFVQAYAFRRAPWRWPVLTLTAWAVGAGVGAFLTFFGGEVSQPPSQLGAGVNVLSAYLCAVAGASLKWATLRIARQR